MKNYTAFEFLPLYFEFKAMTPDISQWNEKSLKDNPPRFYRLLQLKSLIKAFGLEIDLSEFESGNFIHKKDISEYKFLLKGLEKFAQIENNKDETDEIDNSDIEHVFRQYFKLLEAIFIVKSCNSGLIEVKSVSARFTYTTSKLFVEELNNLQHLMRIEMIIASIIDPESREYSKSDLIEKYNFPDVDLFDIDLDWM